MNYNKDMTLQFYRVTKYNFAKYIENAIHGHRCAAYGGRYAANGGRYAVHGG